jgi:hypothetical protein
MVRPGGGTVLTLHQKGQYGRNLGLWQASNQSVQTARIWALL